MGARKAQLNNLAKEIWLWCEKRNIWLSVFHIPGKLNIRADELSRLGKKLNDDMEWALQQEAYNAITTKMGICDIDLCASKRNKKLETYVSEYQMIKQWQLMPSQFHGKTIIVMPFHLSV